MQHRSPIEFPRAIAILMSILAVLVSTPVHGVVGLVEGNKPLRMDDSPWPGLLAVFNDVSRVLYAVGPTTEQTAFYQGDTTVLERVLRAFATVKIEERVVILLPGRGEGFPWPKKDSFYDWRLEANHGNPSIQVPEKDRGLGLPTHPTLTVFVGGAIDLEKLRIPTGITLVGIDTLRARYRQGLLNRGEVEWRIAQLDPYGDAKYAEEVRRIRDFIFAWRYPWLEAALHLTVVLAAVLLCATLVAAWGGRRRRREPKSEAAGQPAGSR